MEIGGIAWPVTTVDKLIVLRRIPLTLAGALLLLMFRHIALLLEPANVMMVLSRLLLGRCPKLSPNLSDNALPLHLRVTKGLNLMYLLRHIEPNAQQSNLAHLAKYLVKVVLRILYKSGM